MEKELVNAAILLLLVVTCFTAGHRIRTNEENQWELFVRFLSCDKVFDDSLFRNHAMYGGKAEDKNSVEGLLSNDALGKIKNK